MGGLFNLQTQPFTSLHVSESSRVMGAATPGMWAYQAQQDLGVGINLGVLLWWSVAAVREAGSRDLHREL